MYCVGFEAKILHKPCTEPYILEHELNTNLGEGKVKFEEGKVKLGEGKVKFEEGKVKFEEGKVKLGAHLSKTGSAPKKN